MWKLLVLLANIGFAPAQIEEVFAWRNVSFLWPSNEVRDEAIRTGQYEPKNNLPLGVDRWKDKLFVTLPRWKSGAAASLTYIPLNAPYNKSAPLIPYPDWKANTLPRYGEKPDDNHIASTFRVRVDPCDRLWVMDTGLVDILGEGRIVSPKAIVIFDLKTDQLIRRYDLKPSDLKEDSFFANIIVDVDPNHCEDAFAYVPDLGGYGLVVYSFLQNESWRIKHNFFHFDPLKGDLTVGGVNFQWTDGVFGLALGPRQANGFRTMYFHALASTKEFSVSTEVLQNKEVATDPNSYYLFKLEGNRGDFTQSSASDFDDVTNVLFLTQITRDGLACWNPRRPLNPHSLVLLAQDKEKLIFTNDLKIDADRNLWILSDRMPAFMYDKLDSRDVNYRIFRANIDDLVRNTPCMA